MTDDQYNELVDYVQRLNSDMNTLSESISKVDAKVENTKYLTRLLDVNAKYPAENDILIYDKTGKWKNIQYDEVGIEGGGGGIGGSSDIYVIGIGDDTPPNNENVFSAARTIEDWVSSKNPDDVEGTLTFKNGAKIIVDGIQSNKMTQGTTLGTGFLYSIDSNNNSYIEVDSLCVRKSALFNELEIKKVTSIGGSLVVSPANNTIIRVDEVSAIYEGQSQEVWRCYYRNVDDETQESIVTDFQAGDLAKIQTFNIKNAGIYENVSNHYYWGLVLGTGSNDIGGYIDLSKTDKDSLSNSGPKVGDALVMYGNKNDSRRQNVIDITTYANNAPAITLYQGINSYSTADKAVIELAYDRDQTQNQAYFNVFGRAYIGNKNQTSYMKFDPTEDDGVGRLTVKGNFILESGQSVEEYVQDNTNDSGFTNLLLNSKLDNNDGWQANYSASITIFDEYACLKATGSYAGFYTSRANNARLIPYDGTITNSVDVYVTKECDIAIGCEGLESNRIHVSEVNTWTRVHNTQELVDHNGAYVIYVIGDNDTVAYFKMAKCETGTTATPWTPATEDLQGFTGRNLVVRGNLSIQNSTSYKITSIYTSKDLEVGKIYTAVMSADTGDDQHFGLYDSAGVGKQGDFIHVSGRIHKLNFSYTKSTSSSSNSILQIYNIPQSGASSNPADVDWICIYEGTVDAPNTFVPAPEDDCDLIAYGGHYTVEKSQVQIGDHDPITQDGRGFHLWKLDTLRMKLTAVGVYDVYDSTDAGGKTEFIDNLNGITGDNIAIVTSQYGYTINESMMTALNNFGASIDETVTQTRTSFVLVGQKNIGKGNGEMRTSTSKIVSVASRIVDGKCVEFFGDNGFSQWKQDTKTGIKKTEESVEAYAQRVTQIEGTVNGYEDRMTIVEDASLRVLPSEISSKVSQTTYDENNRQVEQKFSDITQTADSIRLTVGEIEGNYTSKDKIISTINMSPENITISSSKINLQGVITFSMFSSDVNQKFTDIESFMNNVDEDVANRVDEAIQNNKNLADKFAQYMETKTYIANGVILTKYIDTDEIFAKQAKIGGFNIESHALTSINSSQDSLKGGCIYFKDDNFILMIGNPKLLNDDAQIPAEVQSYNMLYMKTTEMMPSQPMISLNGEDTINLFRYTNPGIQSKGATITSNHYVGSICTAYYQNTTSGGINFTIDGFAYNTYYLHTPNATEVYIHLPSLTYLKEALQIGIFSSLKSTERLGVILNFILMPTYKQGRVAFIFVGKGHELATANDPQLYWTNQTGLKGIQLASGDTVSFYIGLSSNNDYIFTPMSYSINASTPTFIR